MSKILRKLIEQKGSRAKVAAFMAKRGIDFHPARFQRIFEGKNCCSPRLAVEIEHATRGRIQALDVMKESLPWWRKKLGLNQYSRIGVILNKEDRE